MPSRRDLFKYGVFIGASAFAAKLANWRALNSLMIERAMAQGALLDPTTIPKYGTNLIIPPAMPKQTQNGVDYYNIAVRPFEQQILPPNFNPTTVWSYSSLLSGQTINYPAYTIETEYNQPVKIKWVNLLVDRNRNYIPHILTVDQTLHWANTPGGITCRDKRPDFTGQPTPGTYTGPVPIVTHVHGAHTTDESDGYTEAWYLPVARNIPQGYATEGNWYEFFKNKAAANNGDNWNKGSATFTYPNDQRATTMWYHDHTLGLTRLNVYAGPAGFYIIRGGSDDLPNGVLPGPAPALGDPAGTKYYEIPMAIQDRSFKPDGSLFYPSSREFFDGFAGPFIPESDVPPAWNPEFFGNTMVVNGRTWPNLNVEPRRYRFRLLNGCNSRFLILRMVTGDPSATPPAPAALPFWQIGNDGGFLTSPAQLNDLLMIPAERADVIVDFTSLPVGTEIYLINEGPDEPFGGGVPDSDFDSANPQTTGQVMKFTVVPLTSTDTSTPPDQLTLPIYNPLPSPTVTRKVSLLEEESPTYDIPVATLLGTVDANGAGVTQLWADPITENPVTGSTEIWEIYNYTVDAHPIHLHEVQFEVVNRQPFDPTTGQTTGSERPPESWETGVKDMVIAYPGEITRIKATFDLPGNYVWHCHIVEHEDNEMMRPYRIGAVQNNSPEQQQQ